MKNLSLRWIVAATVITLMLLTAAVSLSITFHFSLEAGKSAGTLHAEALGRNARDRLQHTLGKPIGMLRGQQYVLQQDYNPLPSDHSPTYTPSVSAANAAAASAASSGTSAATAALSDPLETAAAAHGIGSWFIPWWTRFTGSMAAGDFAYQFAVMGFNDGNYAGCKMLSPADAVVADQVHQCRVFSWHNRTVLPTVPTTNTTLGETKDTQSIVFQRNYNSSTAAVVGQAALTTSYDPRTRTWWNLVDHKPLAMQWSGVYLSAIPTLPIVDVNAAMYNASGHLLGISSLTFELSFLSDFIQEVKGTPGSRAVLIDNEGLLLASNYEESYLVETNLTAVETQEMNDAEDGVPSNCLLSDVSNDATRSIMLCRHSLSSYPWPELNQIALEYPGLLSTTTTTTAVSSATSSSLPIYVERLSLDDAGGSSHTFYVAVSQVQVEYSTGMEWRFLTLVPEADVTGVVVQGRNIALVVVTVTTVFSGLICVFLLYKLLSPLQTLAWGMFDMATMRDDTLRGDYLVQLSDQDSHSSSSSKCIVVEEVQTLQEAFGILSSELRKVKSYLPASVLIGLYSDYDSEDEDDDQEEAANKEGGTYNDDDDDDDEEEEKSFPGSSHKTGSSSRYPKTRTPSISSLHSSGAATNKPKSRRPSQKTTGESSRRSGGIRPSGAPLSGGLNTALSLTQRRVTVMQCNLQGFHALTKQLDSQEVSVLYSQLVDLVFATVIKKKGVVQSFHGDHFMVSFNAATFAGNQCSAAAQAGLELVEAVDALFSSRRSGAGSLSQIDYCLHVGIASGQALVGNMGSASRRQFCVIGPVVSQAAILERLCCKYNPSPTSNTLTPQRGVCLVAGSTLLSEISPFVEYKLQDCLHFPVQVASTTGHTTGGVYHGGLGGVPNTHLETAMIPPESRRTHRHGRLLVATLCKVKESKQDEWMYELQDSDATSTTAGHNNALERFVEGKTDVALQLWATHLELVKDDPVAEYFVGVARGYLARGKDSSSYVQSTADYYTTCILKAPPAAAAELAQPAIFSLEGNGAAQPTSDTFTNSPSGGTSAFPFLTEGSAFRGTTPLSTPATSTPTTTPQHPTSKTANQQG